MTMGWVGGWRGLVLVGASSVRMRCITALHPELGRNRRDIRLRRRSRSRINRTDNCRFLIRLLPRMAGMDSLARWQTFLERLSFPEECHP